VSRRANDGVAVWDPLVRLLHWTLAAGVVVAYASGDHGGRLHEWVGYVALGAGLLRIAWGFLGSRHARFADFVPGPAGLAAYCRSLARGREPRYVGHNPLGGAWILLMLALVAATGATGVVLAYREIHVVEELHEALAAGLMVAAAIHLAGVAWESLRHGENLVRAMVTGRKRAPEPGDR
jgi:cytochrome b